MTELEPRAFLDIILRLFHDEGWRDRDDAAAALTVAVASTPGGAIAEVDVESVIPPDFLERNDIDTRRLGRALDRVLNDARIRPIASDFELVSIDDIDSFSLVREVRPEQVVSFSAPLIINERVIKHCVHDLISDPYIDSDWGGERSDIESARVALGGQRVASAFLLKGRSVTGPLYGAELGKRGDQIIRLLAQRAQLSVVQHVHTIPNETVDQLRYGVIALRATGAVTHAQASVWDGVDTARLLLAAGYIDADGGLTVIWRGAQPAAHVVNGQSGPGACGKPVEQTFHVRAANRVAVKEVARYGS